MGTTYVQVSLTEEEIKLLIVSIEAQMSVFEGMIAKNDTPIDRIPAMERFVYTYKRIKNKLKLSLSK